MDNQPEIEIVTALDGTEFRTLVHSGLTLGVAMAKEDGKHASQYTESQQAVAHIALAIGLCMTAKRDPEEFIPAITKFLVEMIQKSDPPAP